MYIGVTTHCTCWHVAGSWADGGCWNILEFYQTLLHVFSLCTHFLISMLLFHVCGVFKPNPLADNVTTTAIIKGRDRLMNRGGRTLFGFCLFNDWLFL